MLTTRNENRTSVHDSTQTYTFIQVKILVTFYIKYIDKRERCAGTTKRDMDRIMNPLEYRCFCVCTCTGRYHVVRRIAHEYIYITSSLSISFWSVVVVGGGSDRGVGLEHCGGRGHGGRGTDRRQRD